MRPRHLSETDEGQIRKVESIKGTERVMVVIDDCPHLGNIDHKLSDGVALVVDKLQRATDLTDFHPGRLPRFTRGSQFAQIWSDKVPSAD